MPLSRAGEFYAGTEYTSVGFNLPLRRYSALTFIPIQSSVAAFGSTPISRVRKSVFAPSNSISALLQAVASGQPAPPVPAGLPKEIDEILVALVEAVRQGD